MTLPEGLIYVPHFLTEAEERDAVAVLAAFELHPYVLHDTPSRRLVRSFGRALVAGAYDTGPAAPIPAELQWLRERCAPLRVRPVRPGAGTMAAPHPSSHQGAVVDDASHPAAPQGQHAVSGRTRLTVRVHPRARTERLEWDGSTLQLWVREPPADGRANAAVIRAVARWADVAPSQVAIVSGAAARHKLVEIEREDALPPPAV